MPDRAAGSLRPTVTGGCAMGDNKTRYTIDFDLVPSLFHKDPTTFHKAFPTMLGMLLPGVYNESFKKSQPFWKRSTTFGPKDFPYTRQAFPDGIIVEFVSLPPATDTSPMYCTAFALVSRGDTLRFYTVERSALNTTAIGTVDANGGHHNFGPGGRSRQEDMELVHAVFLSDRSAHPFTRSSSSLSQDAGSSTRQPPSSPVARSAKTNTISIDVGSTSSDSNYDPSFSDISFSLANAAPQKSSAAKNPSPVSTPAAKPATPAASAPAPKSGRTPKKVDEDIRLAIAGCPNMVVPGEQEEEGRKLAKKIRDLRSRGASSEALHALEGKLVALMPEYVRKHTKEVFQLLEQDLTCFCLVMEQALDKRKGTTTRKMAEPMAEYLMSNKKTLFGNRLYFPNAIEQKLYMLDKKKKAATPVASGNYVRFLVNYGRAIILSDDLTRSQTEADAQKYLELALEMDPVDPAAWLYLAVAKEEPAYFNMALHYCYHPKGYCGLTRIYEEMGIYYLQHRRTDIATALDQMLASIGTYTVRLSSYLRYYSAPEKRPFKTVLQENNIPIGFSELVMKALNELSSASKVDDPALVKKTQRDALAFQGLLSGFRKIT